jgi:GntR family transcriptional regulator
MPVNFARQPLFLQVYEALADRITSGVWTPGHLIPSETELAREFGVSAGTMRKALEVLEARHLVERRQGRGTFVLDHATDEMAFRFVNLFDAEGERITSTKTKLLSQSVAAAMPAEVEKLNTAPGEKVMRTRRVRDHKNRPFSYEEAAIRIAQLPGFQDEADPPGDYLLVPFAQKHGTRLGHAVEKITYAVASSEIGRALDVEPRTPLLKLDRVVHSITGEPVEWRMALCNLSGGYYVATMI